MRSEVRARSYSWRGVVAACAVMLGVLVPMPAASAAPADAWTSPTAGPGNTTTNAGESVVTAATAAQVRRAWTVEHRVGVHSAPAVVGGVAYFVDNPSNANDPSRLMAVSARTGARLWSLLLPARQSYESGMSVVGTRAVLAYQGYQKRAGITAVDLGTRRVAWNRAFPAVPDEYSWLADWLPAELVADSRRIYVTGGSTNLAAYRLTDGAPVWALPFRVPFDAHRLAVSGDVVYTGRGVNGTDGDGVTAWSASTGRKLWTAPGGGRITVAGGRVFSTTETAVTAVAAAGCGRAVCPALWTREIPELRNNSMRVGAADASTVFVSYSRDDGDRGMLMRLSAATGAVQWQVATGSSNQGLPVRAADAVWVLSPSLRYEPGVGGVWTYRVKGFAATGSRTAPLRTLTLPSYYARMGGHMELAIAAGAVLARLEGGALVGYRIPGR